MTYPTEPAGGTFVDPLAPVTPASVDAPASPVPTSPAAAAASVVQLTQEQLNEMLRQAVAAGAAQASATMPLGMPAIVAEQPEQWSQNRLMHEILTHLSHGFFSERQARSATAAVDKWFPSDDDAEE